MNYVKGCAYVDHSNSEKFFELVFARQGMIYIYDDLFAITWKWKFGEGNEHTTSRNNYETLLTMCNLQNYHF